MLDSGPGFPRPFTTTKWSACLTPGGCNSFAEVTPMDSATTSHLSRLCRKGRRLSSPHLAPCGLAPVPQSLPGQRAAVTGQDKPLPLVF